MTFMLIKAGISGGGLPLPGGWIERYAWTRSDGSPTLDPGWSYCFSVNGRELDVPTSQLGQVLWDTAQRCAELEADNALLRNVADAAHALVTPRRPEPHEPLALAAALDAAREGGAL